MNKRGISFTFTLTFLLAIFIYGVIVTVGNSPTTTIYVDPPTSMASVSQIFTIDISISNVVDLYGWRFKLRWNSSILDAVHITEGNFLKRGGITFFTSKINNTEGYILADCTLLGNVSGVGGNGTLATINFFVEERGESILDLYDTTLVSSLEQSIAHTVIDGYGYFMIRDVAITNISPSKTTVTSGEIVYIYVTVENQGDSSETFTVTAFYTLVVDPVIQTQTITLARGVSETIPFTWDTTGVLGRCMISAEASIVSGETDTFDNTLFNGVVLIE